MLPIYTLSNPLLQEIKNWRKQGRKYYWTSVTDDSSTDLPKYASILVHAQDPPLAFLSHSADLFHPLCPTAVANRRQCGIGISFRAKRRGHTSFFPPLPSIVVPHTVITFDSHCMRVQREGGGAAVCMKKRKKEMGRYRNKPSRYEIRDEIIEGKLGFLFEKTRPWIDSRFIELNYLTSGRVPPNILSPCPSLFTRHEPN